MPLPGDQHKDTPASFNPFVPPVPRMSEYTAREVATLQARLDRQLGPEYISTRQGAGGGKVHYLAGEKVINLSNEVFGFNGWSSSIQTVQIDFVDENATNGKISLGLSIVVRVTLRDGSFHEDIGYGHIENCKGKAAAFEKAKKEAATDALKRALRNFGNVLGNCLYDKDYLSKVTKIKAGPSRWDINNLHRHPDYAPIKPESIEEADAGHEQQRIDIAAKGNARALARNTSAGSTDIEDDYGGNLFDETDLSNPDEVQLDEPRPFAETPTGKHPQAPNQQQLRQGPQRMQSMPQLRPPNAQPGLQPTNVQAVQPRLQARTGQPTTPFNGSKTLPPHAQGQPTRTPQQANTGQVMHHQLDGQAVRSNSSSGSTVADSSVTNAQPQTGLVPDEEYRPPPPQPIPAGIPDGFVAARGAEYLNRPPNSAKPLSANLDFDPHKESPSIRKTHGANPGKSAPVRRDVTHQPVYEVPLSQIAGNRPHQNIASHQTHPQNNISRPQSPATRLPNTTAPTNFVNPAADPARRIGMPPPPTGASMQNRGQYRPPSAVKRPALADVSNLQQVQEDGLAENTAKKQKTEGSVPRGGDQSGQDGPIAAT
ncbi:hypothetical protein K431DRAFT_348900 [Polychaeton citri CBS 116435]|uniref:RAD52 homolog n=1 Tax=Polychaeton citri CBS 116435 TaxID=1314669 RepID=A0A9P4Q2A3_9PEZI|nr:hypothetical protein K431DRAFT_348900 [Polychaeton citri CBS 116435]